MAQTARGTVELWAPAGKVAVVDICERRSCSVLDAAADEFGVWLLLASDAQPAVVRVDSAGRSRVVTLPGLEPLASVSAVSGRGDEQWFAVDDHLYRLSRSGLTKLDRQGAGWVSGLAISPDGRRLAYAFMRFPRALDYSRGASIVVRDLVDGTERRIDNADDSIAAAYDLAWSPDGHHLAFQLGFEGGLPHVVDLDAPVRLDLAPVLGMPGPERVGYGFRGVCWSSPATVAFGTWPIPGIEAQGLPGDLADTDVVTGATRLRGVRLFGFGVVCRADGAVALVDRSALEDPAVGLAPASGDLVVVRSDGSTAVLGHDYTWVLGL